MILPVWIILHRYFLGVQQDSLIFLVFPSPFIPYSACWPVGFAYRTDLYLAEAWLSWYLNWTCPSKEDKTQEGEIQEAPTGMEVVGTKPTDISLKEIWIISFAMVLSRLQYLEVTLQFVSHRALHKCLFLQACYCIVTYCK